MCEEPITEFSTKSQGKKRRRDESEASVSRKMTQLNQTKLAENAQGSSARVTVEQPVPRQPISIMAPPPIMFLPLMTMKRSMGREEKHNFPVLPVLSHPMMFAPFLTRSNMVGLCFFEIKSRHLVFPSRSFVVDSNECVGK